VKLRTDRRIGLEGFGRGQYPLDVAESGILNGGGRLGKAPIDYVAL
jgi:hypothetical protein